MRRASSGMASVLVVVGDVEQFSASLAVDGVHVVSLQAAGRAGEAYLVRTEQGQGEADEEGDPGQHGDDRDHPAPGSWQGDVAKAGRR